MILQKYKAFNIVREQTRHFSGHNQIKWALFRQAYNPEHAVIKAPLGRFPDMKTLFSTILLVQLFTQIHGQQNVIFDFEDDVPEAVTHIFINLNFHQVSEIPATIGQFTGLRELTFFEQSAFFADGNCMGNGVRLESDMREVPIHFIPSEISLCKELEVLQITEGMIDLLPESMKDLDKLRILELPDGGTLDNMIDVIADMSSLELLVCFGCVLSVASRRSLLTRNPDLVFLVTEDELFTSANKRPKYVVEINQSCGIAYSRHIEAEMFIESMSQEDRDLYNISFSVDVD